MEWDPCSEAYGMYDLMHDFPELFSENFSKKTEEERAVEVHNIMKHLYESFEIVSLEEHKCQICGTPYAKWRFCLVCGEMNLKYHSQDEIKSEEMPNVNRSW